jgi:hypothetical protein
MDMDTDAQKIRKLTSIEDRLLAAHDALAAVVDDEDALAEAIGRNSPAPMSVGEQLSRAKNTACWAVDRVRAELRRLGAMEAGR